MTRSEMEIQALCALTKATEAGTPEVKKEWLKVAEIWYQMRDWLAGESPDNGFMEEYPELEGELVRLVLRVFDDGSTQVICDPYERQPIGANAEDLEQAFSLAGDLLRKAAGL